LVTFPFSTTPEKNKVCTGTRAQKKKKRKKRKEKETKKKLFLFIKDVLVAALIRGNHCDRLGTRGCQILLGPNIPKLEKCTKLPQTIPNCHLPT
jgi:hypothetical protein